MSFKAWILVDNIKRDAFKLKDFGDQAQKLKSIDPFSVPNRWIHDHWSHELAHGFAHADQMLLASGVLLIAHWIIWGVFVAWNYGRNINNLKYVCS